MFRKNGEITDPPVAATKAAPAAARYAHPGTAPAADAAADEIFCPTCLKNQHLFTASLAQYLPDDPSHPDYAELERGYYKFRRGLEQRYPQACADCAPKVLARIRQADYTAKTDHLRRMIDQSRAGRSRNRSALEIVDAVAGRLWQAGLVLQLLWQLSHLSILLPDQTFADESRPARILVGTLRPLLERLPEGSKLLEWSVSASVLSCWWNPRLPQTVRGFTKHIVGLGNWYAYQAITVLIRLGLWQFCRLSLHDAPALAILSVHLFVALASIGVSCPFCFFEWRPHTDSWFGRSTRSLRGQFGRTRRRCSGTCRAHYLRPRPARRRKQTTGRPCPTSWMRSWSLHLVLQIDLLEAITPPVRPTTTVTAVPAVQALEAPCDILARPQAAGRIHSPRVTPHDRARLSGWVPS